MSVPKDRRMGEEINVKEMLANIWMKGSRWRRDYGLTKFSGTFPVENMQRKSFFFLKEENLLMTIHGC